MHSFRLCSDTAYILGSTIELEKGLEQFLKAFTNCMTTDTIDIVETLCRLLTHQDSECVLNAAGTLGTIVRKLGRP